MVEVMDVGRDLAQRWLKECHYEGQRKLRTDHVTLLAGEMAAGRFLPLTQIAFAVLGTRQFLINGQHTLSAIVASGLSQRLAVAYHGAQSFSEVGHLYGRYDRHKQRSMGEVMHGLGAERTWGLNQTQIAYFCSALRVLAADLNMHRARAGTIAPDVLWEIGADYVDAMHRYVAVTKNAAVPLNQTLMRATTLSVGLALFRWATDALGDKPVVDFWDGLARDDGLHVGDPRKTLHTHLLSTSMTGGGVTVRKQISISQAIWAVARCWNAWAASESLRVIHYPVPLVAPRLQGTPFS